MDGSLREHMTNFLKKINIKLSVIESTISKRSKDNKYN